jgi:hypothetical protein
LDHIDTDRLQPMNEMPDLGRLAGSLAAFQGDKMAKAHLRQSPTNNKKRAVSSARLLCSITRSLSA